MGAQVLAGETNDDLRKKLNAMDYPLYDVPYLVRDPNEYRMSEKRHQTELRNQAVVDDYFIARDKGSNAHDACQITATKHEMTPRQVYGCLVWYFQEAKRRHIVIPDL